MKSRTQHCADRRRTHKNQPQSARFVSMESLERRELLSAFVSTAGVGNWSALSTWATQDGGTVTHIPGSGDTVTINGKVTVDVATTIGTGSGDVITLGSSANVGDKKLTVAAPLTVQGSILSQGKSVVDVLAGAGIEFDAAAGGMPKLHVAAYGNQVNLYLHGTADNHSYVRTKVGSAGQPAIITADIANVVTNIGATYADFTDLNGGPAASAYPGSPYTAYGLFIIPNTEGLLTGMDHCTFTRTTMYLKASSFDVTISNSYFDQGLLVPYGDTKYEAFFVGNGAHINLVNSGFDLWVWLESMKTLTGDIFQGGVHFNAYGGTGFQTWSDNMMVITEPSSGYFQPMSGTYNRNYVICPVVNPSNPHIIGAGTNTTFIHSLWDVPTAHDVDDGLMQLSAGVKNNSIQQCISLPRMGGAYPGSGTSLGFVGGTNVSYDHNTIAIGMQSAIASDPSHGGTTGGMSEFKSNIGYTLDGVTGGGHLIYAYPSTYVDAVAPGMCDYNAKYNTDYSMTTTVAPGAHDLNGQNPNFIDSSRNLIKYYRMQPGVVAGTVDADATAAISWMRQHPGNMPAMIDWIFRGFIPTNIAYKAAADNVAPTNGWIGAMEGKPVGDANLDGKTNFQDYILLERNFGQTNVGWEGGDFNTDGVVNFQDYILLERNFGTSYVSAAPTPDVATPIELAANITPVTATDLPVSTPVVGPVAPAYLLNGTATAGMASTLFSGDAPMALPTMSGTGPSLRTVTWPKAQKWQVPPVKGAIDAMTIDLLGALAM